MTHNNYSSQHSSFYISANTLHRYPHSQLQGNMQMPGGGNSGHLHGCNVTVEAYCKWTQGWLAWLKKPTCCLWTAVVFAETAPVRKVRILPLFVYCQVRESVTVPAGRALFRMTLILNSAMSMIPKVMQNQWQLVHSIFPPGMPWLKMRPCQDTCHRQLQNSTEKWQLPVKYCTSWFMCTSGMGGTRLCTWWDPYVSAY